MEPSNRLNIDRIEIRLLEIDRAILHQLCEGRCTTGYIAEEIGEQQPYVSRRLGELVDGGIVTRVHRGLYELEAEYRTEAIADE